MVDSAVLLYYKGAYYNTLPLGKKFFIQLRIGQAAGDGVEGEHQMQELTAGKARADEQEAEDEEDDHVELVAGKVQPEGEAVGDAHDEAAVERECQLQGWPVCSGRRTQCRSCHPSGL